MMETPIVPLSLAAVCLALVAACAVLAWRKKRKDVAGKKFPPGPTPLPLFGSLYYLAKFDIPFAGFTYLRKFYGDIFSIRLGTTDCVVVNSVQLRDKVLVDRASDFDGRPDFVRFKMLFGGDKQNGNRLTTVF